MSGAEALDSFLDHSLEKRQGVKVACPEEIAFDRGWINADQLVAEAHRLGKELVWALSFPLSKPLPVRAPYGGERWRRRHSLPASRPRAHYD